VGCYREDCRARVDNWGERFSRHGVPRRGVANGTTGV
jgi:hypothetical protein